MLSELFYPYLLGGAERRYYEIAKRLAKRHDVVVISLRFDGHESSEMHEGIEIERVGSSHPLDKRSLPALATYLPAIAKAVKRKSDIIDANQGIASFAGIFKPLLKKPVVATFHDLYWKQWNEYFPFPFSSLGRAMEFSWAKMPFSAVIANSPTTARKLGYLGTKNIKTIPSGIDFDFISNMRAIKKRNTVIYVGRLVKYKNVDLLIRAVKEASREIKDIELKIVGSGPEEFYLKNLAKDLAVDAKFFGFVSEEEKFRLIKSSEVLVNPSSVEGLGLILLEAMAAGTPVIARNLDAYFFCNSKNSVIYGKDSELAANISLILQNNTKKTIIKNGYETARNYSWDNVAASVEKLYGMLI